MYFHSSRSGIWADGNFSLVTKEESYNKKKTPRKKTEVPCEGGDRRSRTDDPLLAKQMLQPTELYPQKFGRPEQI